MSVGRGVGCPWAGLGAGGAAEVVMAERAGLGEKRKRIQVWWQDGAQT